MPLDVLDDLDGGPLDVGHVLAVGVLAEEARGADDDVDAVDAGRDGELGVLHGAADIWAGVSRSLAGRGAAGAGATNG